MQEIWKDVVNYEGLYQVSNFGNVKSISRTVKRNPNKTGNLPLKSRLLSPVTRRNGYKRVSLSKNGETKSFYVHRLVAEAFISNPNNYQQVNHKDENKGNNCVGNLEWCTRDYNMKYGTIGIRISKSKSNMVFQYDLYGNLIRSFQSVKQAHENTKISESSIYNCCLGYSKSAGGFIWSFCKTKKP